MENQINEISAQWDDWIGEHGLERLNDRDAAISARIDQALIDVDASNEIKDMRKSVLKAKLMTILPTYNDKARELLEKVVKRDPTDFEAWNLLGEQYWRNGKIQMARQCFEGSLSKRANSRSLRSLSMILRAMPEKDQKAKMANVKQSFQKAKQAVDLDDSNGLNWYVLSNAYLTLFVNSTGVMKRELIKKAYAGYERAEKLGENYNPDLHYNRAQLHLYDEQWQAAHESLTLAAKYDPEWSLPKDRIKNIENFCEQVITCCINRGKLSQKRLTKLMAKLSDANDVLCVATLSHFDYLPFCLIGLNKQMEASLITVYNMKRGSGPIIGDVVTLPDFTESKCNFSLADKSYTFVSRRVENLEKMKINNKQLGGSAAAQVQSLNF